MQFPSRRPRPRRPTMSSRSPRRRGTSNDPVSRPDRVGTGPIGPWFRGTPPRGGRNHEQRDLEVRDAQARGGTGSQLRWVDRRAGGSTGSHGDAGRHRRLPERPLPFNPSLIWLPLASATGRHHVPRRPDAGLPMTSASGTSRPPGSTRRRTGVGLADGRVARLRLPGRRHSRVPQRLTSSRAEENATTITTLEQAGRAGAGWRGSSTTRATSSSHQPGAGCFRRGVRFLFSTAYHLKRRAPGPVRPIYVTAEPFLGHFGIGGLPNGEKLLGMFLKKEGIDAQISVGIDHIDDGAIHGSPTVSRSPSATPWSCRRSGPGSS